MGHVTMHRLQGETGTANFVKAELAEGHSYGFEWALAVRAGNAERASVISQKHDLAAKSNDPFGVSQTFATNLEKSAFATAVLLRAADSGKTIGGFSGDELLVAMLATPRGSYTGDARPEAGTKEAILKGIWDQASGLSSEERMGWLAGYSEEVTMQRLVEAPTIEVNK
jgi:hypothetical protein